MPLAGAAFKGDLPVARLLVARGAAVDGGERTAPMVAAMFDREEIAALLLDHGADPARRDGGGLTLRDLAGKMGAEKVVALIAAREAGAVGERLR